MQSIYPQAPASPLRRRFSFPLAASFAISVGLHLVILENPSWHQLTVGSSEGNSRIKHRLQVEFDHSLPPVVAPSDTTENISAIPEKPDHTELKKGDVADHNLDAPAALSLPAPDPQTGFIPGPWYFPARLLHQRPQPTRSIEPEYPEAGREIDGLVVLTLLIGESGSVDDYRLDSAVPPGIFERSAIAAFSTANYTPGRINGKAVRSQLKVEIRYSPGEKPQATFIGLPQ